MKVETEGGTLAPDDNEEVFLYQTLVGAWPLDRAEVPELRQRIASYLEKALREAKVHSSWLEPDTAYENAVRDFVHRTLADGSPFRKSFEPFVERIASHGAWSSLAQVVLKVAAPGIPDIYQGTELWDLSLVDPDNRRPVDFPLRRRLLAELQDRWDAGEPERDRLPAELLVNWRDGRIKLFTTWRSLEARRAEPELFTRGEHLPIAPQGRRGRNIFAFARHLETQDGSRWAIAAIPRWLARWNEPDRPPLGAAWGRTRLPLPDGAPRTWRAVLTGRTIEARGRLRPRLPAADLFEQLPVALLLAD